MKHITTNHTREKMLDGMYTVFDIVSKTMGPKGRNVAIQEGTLQITNDGVTVVNSIESQDPVENIGIQMIKASAEKTNKEAGDGTTTTSILTYAIAREGNHLVTALNLNPFSLAKGLQYYGNKVTSYISRTSKSITEKEEVKQVANISAQDDEVAEMIADIIDEVGSESVITVEEGTGIGLTKVIKKGLHYDTGVASAYMMNTQDNEFIGENIATIVTDLRITSMSQLKPIIKQLMDIQIKDLVLFTPEIETEPLQSLLLNKINGIFNCTVVMAPGFGELRLKLLSDISAFTGAVMIANEKGLKLETMTLDQVGTINKIKCTMESTIITSDIDIEPMPEYLDSIRKDIETAKTEFEKIKHEERLSKFLGGIAVIKVGAKTQMEMEQRKFKIEDALNATRSALEEGIVAGAGMALGNIIIPTPVDGIESLEEKCAREILNKALKYPRNMIIKNAGYDVDKVLEEMPLDKGFDSKEGVYCDLIESGIIDPVKVIRVALENAISSAIMLLTTEATISLQPNDFKPCEQKKQPTLLQKIIQRIKKSTKR